MTHLRHVGYLAGVMGRIGAAVLSKFLLDLHDRANEVGFRELQRHAFERLAELIPFDGGLVGLGTVQNGVPTGRDVVLHRKPPEMMASWNEIRHEDRIATWAFANPGKTGAFDTSGSIYEGFTGVVEHCRVWGMAHILCTAMIDPDTGLYWVMSLYRSDAQQAYTEDERSTMELIVPHLVSSGRRARLGQLRARTRGADIRGEAAIVANDDGVILEAEPCLPVLLRAQWPDWKGPVLPKEFVAAANEAPETRVVHGVLALRADRADGVVLYHVRRSLPADRLTAREREVAEAFASGATYLELADTLSVAPNTVRRHLSNIYEKLGISSKAELEKMIRD